MSRILAIDDNADNLISVQALLRLFIPDCEVITAQSGREGIRVAAAQHPDTILLDIHMPEMDGFQVCRELKADPLTADIPIIMLTALKTGTQHRIKALDLGADAFLTKPVNEAELAAQVKAMLRIKHAEDILRREKAQLEDDVQARMNDLLIANDQLMIEIREREQAEATLRRESVLNKAMAGISRELLSEIYDLEKVSEITLAHARELTRSSQGFISAIDQKSLDSLGHTMPYTGGTACKIPAENRADCFAMNPDGTYSGLWGHALNTREAFYTNDPGAHPSAAGLPPGHIPLENFMAVPVFINEALQGMICLGNAGQGFSDQDLDAVCRISEVFALALHRKNYESEREELEKNLRQLQKNEAIGALAGGIAHDFNNILFPIIGFAELLSEDLAAENTLRASVSEILKGALRAKDLVKQILAFSRQAEQEIRPLRPHLIIKEVTKLIRATIPSTIAIHQRIDPDIRTIMADPTQLHQVAMNLITNAYHAMEENGGNLVVSLENTDTPDDSLDLPPGPHILFTVSDTGIGMDRATREKIFDPYFSTKPRDKGTGLGLSVVHGIVRHYGGDIRVDSTPGEGSSFKVFLPALATDKAPKAATGKAAVPQGSGRILMVDDEPAVLKLVSQVLQRLGYEVDTTLSSLDALIQVQSFPERYDLLITDMTMPKLTGDRLTQKLREQGIRLPIIICTGFSEKMTPDHARALGADALLMKPLVKEELARAISRLIQKPV